MIGCRLKREATGATCIFASTKISFTSRSVWLICILLLSPVNTIAQTLTPEQTLGSLKQALVDYALENEIQLNSSAYLDNGVLHESSVLSSQAMYRGVPTLVDSPERSTSQNQRTTQSERTCDEPRRALRREAVFRIDKDEELFSKHNSLGDHSFPELAAFIAKAFSDHIEGSKNWVVTEEKEYGSDYENYVLGTWADRAPYIFEIKIRPSTLKGGMKEYGKAWFSHGVHQIQGFARRTANAFPGVYYPDSWPSAELQYQLTLIDRATQQQIWNQVGPLFFPRVNRAYFKSQFPSSLAEDIEVLTEEFIQAATMALQCEPHRFQLFVDKSGSGALEINAGLVAGVSIGDKFLISASSDLLQEVLSNPKLDTLALARVESVDDHSAMLKKIAGPSWPQTSEISSAIATHF
ncbi:hypothetical protein ACMAY4_00215 [Porticoccaceae bacterium nBUS_17]